MQTRILHCTALIFSLLVAMPAYAQTTWYKCSQCGRYHARNNAQASVVIPSSAGTGQVVSAASTNNSPTTAVVQAGTTPTAGTRISNATGVVQNGISAIKRWRFDKANNWTRRIDPRAQAWAQEEANRLARRGYQGYLQNGHPGGNNPYARVTGTGTTFPGDDLIHTCEGSPGMTLVAEAAAVSSDGRIYGVRSWR